MFVVVSGRAPTAPEFAGLSAREAAEVMGKQEGTVRGLQFRAIAALRRELGTGRWGGLEAAGRASKRAGDHLMDHGWKLSLAFAEPRDGSRPTRTCA